MSKVRKEIYSLLEYQMLQANDKTDKELFKRIIKNKVNFEEFNNYQVEIDDMKDKGEITEDEKFYYLSEHGFNEIYPILNMDCWIKVKNKIMKRFKETNSQVGDILSLHWLRNSLPEGLNLKERINIDGGIQQCINFNLVKEDHNGSLVLTEEGFIEINK